MSDKSRQLHIDALKALASQLIVLHHLSAYGPVSDTLYQAWPNLIGWFYDEARMAVQVFLVLGGYLAAMSLAPGRQIWSRSPFRVMLNRYRRLVIPCVVALVLAVGSAAITRLWIHSDFVPSSPTLGQSISHLLLLQNLTHQDALTAGIWYVAIDFQLFMIMTLLLWLGHRSHRFLGPGHVLGPGVAQTLVLGLMMASLFFFNRHREWDSWPFYFFGSYAMGACAYWGGHSRCPATWLSLLALTGCMALLLDFRERIALALLVALLLGLLQWHQTVVPRAQRSLPNPVARLISKLGQISYGLFLVHFPVLMLGNALFVWWQQTHPVNSHISAELALALCWCVSIVLAVWFESYVEAPLVRRASSKRSLE